MALPQDGQNANGLTKVTEIPKGKELIFVDPTTNEGGIITLEDLTKQILNNLTSRTFALDQGTKTLPAALNELNSKAFMNTPTISSNVTEYVRSLNEGRTYLFRSTSETVGNPFKSGSCIFMIYIITKGNNGIGISINHSSTAYYLRFAEGEISYTALS